MEAALEAETEDQRARGLGYRQKGVTKRDIDEGGYI